LGCLWGLAEITLGTQLHLSRVPLAGQIMMPVGIWCALGAYRLSPAPGMAMGAGIAAAGMRVFGPGPFLPMPVVAILIEATLMETALLLAGPRRIGYALAGGAAALYPLVHAFAFKTLIFGLPLAAVYASILKQARTTLLGYALAGPAVLALWTALSVLAGCAAGFLVGVLPFGNGRKREKRPSDASGP
jgi:hypothetical protein